MVEVEDILSSILESSRRRGGEPETTSLRDQTRPTGVRAGQRSHPATTEVKIEGSGVED